MSEDKLSVGVVLESTDVPAWKHQLIEDLIGTPYISLELVLLDDTAYAAKTSRIRETLLRWFVHFDQARHQALADACEIVDASEVLQGVEILRMDELPRERSNGSSSVAGDSLSQYDLDAIVLLCDSRHMDRLSKIARHGAWFFVHDFGATISWDSTSIAFREVLRRKPLTEVSLVIRHSSSSDLLVAYQSCSPVDSKSLIRSRNWHLWKIASFTSRCMNRLRREGPEEYFQGLSRHATSSQTASEPIQLLLDTASLFLAFGGYVLWRLSLRYLLPRRRERWQLLYEFGDTNCDLSKFSPIDSPAEEFWADPFVEAHEDEFTIFFENASIETGKGQISHVQLDRDGRVSSPRTILSKPYHLSYPFVFEWDGERYLVPESADNRTVSLYRFKDFPVGLEFVHNLMEDVAVYDATLVEYSGMWWMFANMKAHEGASDWDELHLFYASSPTSQRWQVHPMNPVVSDVRSARPAGRLFVEKGELYRPSQNSSYRYGYGLNIARVTEMTTSRYSEEIVRQYVPDWSRNVTGLHTWNRCRDLTVIDAICRTSSRLGAYRV